MNANQIQAHLRREPFHPIRVHLSDGAHYDVLHPEMVVVTKHEVAIAIMGAEGDLPDRMVYCDPLHVTRLEPVPPAARK